MAPVQLPTPLTEKMEPGVVVPIPTLTPKSTTSLLAPMVIAWPVPAPSMVELAAKTRFAGSPVAPRTTLEPDELAAPIDTEPSLPVVSTSIKGLAEEDVPTVQAYGVPLGMVVVEFTEMLIRPPLKTGVPAKVGDVANTSEPLPV